MLPEAQKKFESKGKIAQWLGQKYPQWTGEIGQIYWDQLWYRTWNAHALLKKYFDMQSKAHPYKGYLGEN